MQTDSIKNFIKLIGLNPSTMEINKPYDVSGYQVESMDKKNNIIWSEITKVIKKSNTEKIVIKTDDFTLSCSPEHKVFVKFIESGEKFFEEAGSLFESEDEFLVLTKKGFQPFEISLSGETEIYDIEVKDSHCYFSNGILSHNTIYGSPDTTTGGTAIPFWASLRVKISNPSPIKKTMNGGEEIVGVSVSAKVIKNKVERPWREASFDIMFEEGISEADHIFDTVREYCERNKEKPILLGNKKIFLSGSSAWKEFTVSDIKTGEIFVSEKFYKSDFKTKILNNPSFQEYIQALLDACYIISQNEIGHITLGKPEPETEVENYADTDK